MKLFQSNQLARKARQSKINQNVFRALNSALGGRKSAKIIRFCTRNSALSYDGQMKLAAKVFYKNL